MPTIKSFWPNLLRVTFIQRHTDVDMNKMPVLTVCVLIHTEQGRWMTAKGEGFANGAYEALSVSYEKQSVFQCVIIFVGAGFEKTLIAPVASGVLSCSAVIMQQGAHLRQPCLLPEPRDWAWCLGQHRKASPMMHGPPLHSLGNNRRVTCCAHPQTLPSRVSLPLHCLLCSVTGWRSAAEPVVRWQGRHVEMS